MSGSGKKTRRSTRKTKVEQIPRSLDVAFPSNRKVHMRYSSWKALTCSSGVITSQVIGCGDLYDPDKTGVGHQPLGFDQWSVFYNNYIVEKAHIKCVFALDASVTGGGTPIVGIFRDNSSTLDSTSKTTLIEQGRSVWKVLPPSVSVPVSTLELDYDAKRDFNLGDVRDAEQRIGALFSGSPSDIMAWQIWCQSLNETTSVTVNVMYVVDFYVIVSQPKELAQS